MAKSKHINPCAHGGQRLRHDDDEVRALRLGLHIHEHWSCFIRHLREQNHRSADTIQSVTTPNCSAST